MNKSKFDFFSTLNCFTLGGIEPTTHKRQGPVTGAEFALQPFQVEERGNKKQSEKNLSPEGYEATTLILQVLHLTARLILQSAKAPVKFVRRYSKVNQVIYLSTPIS